MVEVNEFIEQVVVWLDEGCCAPYAVQQVGQEYDNSYKFLWFATSSMLPAVR